ncbi:hypothetical protein L1D14_18110 [Vibrio tubiashii]|uniref:hypothetical protein n=1 Tax=Vibrio tubiashii TaxID=29498 RepID=UPI001EFD5EA3|nr:hypothetical protein [Vibrio tubiashii]MCG9578132.1 hypothetical protein [Vibrio tubiashii]
MGTLALLGLLLLIVSYGVWQYRKLLKWKHQLDVWQSRLELLRDEVYEERDSARQQLAAWNRDLNRREIAWQEFKEKIEKDLKWTWKI